MLEAWRAIECIPASLFPLYISSLFISGKTEVHYFYLRSFRYLTARISKAKTGENSKKERKPHDLE